MLNHGDNFRIPGGGKASVYIHIQWNSRSFESAGVSEVGVPVCFSGNRFLQEGGSGEGGGDAGEGDQGGGEEEEGGGEGPGG